MIYFPYVYTEEHLEQFYLEAQTHKEVLKQVQEIAKLPTLEAQIDAILESIKLAQLLDKCRKRKGFDITKAVIEKHKRTIKMPVYYYTDKILHSYNLVFSPVTDNFDTEIDDLNRKINAMQADPQLFEEQKQANLAKLKERLENWERKREDFMRENAPFEFDVRTTAHKKKPDLCEFEFIISSSFMEKLNNEMEQFSINFRVELNKSKR